MSTLDEVVVAWYGDHARNLPWRRPGTTPWGVVVSEFMLQQTPVARVLPAWEAWLDRWPTPAALAAEPPGRAIHAWERLGYPRRALRLHATATALVDRHGGRVPADVAELRALPGVGGYTAAAIAAFAHRQRVAVLDTNVRRVLGRVLRGESRPGTSSPTLVERADAERVLPNEPAAAAMWSVSVMELGALVCTARSPRCAGCPLRERCQWLAAGKPLDPTAPTRTQAYAGTDRQVRGRLLAVLRDGTGRAAREQLDAAWDKPVQRARALAGLVADGLVEPLADGSFGLPGLQAPCPTTSC